MDQSTARQSAIAAVTAWPSSNGPYHISPKETRSIRQIFGANILSDEVMWSRWPEDVYKALRNSIKKGAPLDPSIADVVAGAMKEWAMERGATHYTPGSSR